MGKTKRAIKSNNLSRSSTLSQGIFERQPRNAEASSEPSHSNLIADDVDVWISPLRLLEQTHGRESAEREVIEVHNTSMISFTIPEAHHIFSPKLASQRLVRRLNQNSFTERLNELYAARLCELSVLCGGHTLQATGNSEGALVKNHQAIPGYVSHTVSSSAKSKPKHVQLVEVESLQTIQNEKTCKPRPLPPIPCRAAPARCTIPLMAKYAVANVPLESPRPQKPGYHWETIIAEWKGFGEDFLCGQAEVRNEYVDDLIGNLERQAEALSFEDLEGIF